LWSVLYYYKEGKENFVSTYLYGDIQININNIFFGVTKSKPSMGIWDCSG
jgi:hypothetical protein